MAPKRSCCIKEKVDLIESKRSISATHAQAVLAGRLLFLVPSPAVPRYVYECGTQQIKEWVAFLPKQLPTASIRKCCGQVRVDWDREGNEAERE
ncbi:hypothetical protein ACLOJK_001959, partial [Asimina triloba]